MVYLLYILYNQLISASLYYSSLVSIIYFSTYFHISFQNLVYFTSLQLKSSSSVTLLLLLIIFSKHFRYLQLLLYVLLDQFFVFLGDKCNYSRAPFSARIRWMNAVVLTEHHILCEKFIC